MSNETKKFAGLESLQAFLNGCKTLFASITHKHTMSDITDSSTVLESYETKEDSQAKYDELSSEKKDKDLIVTYQEGSAFKITHSSSEIFEAVNNGQTVKFKKGTELLNILESSQDYATFYMFYINMEGKLQQKIVVVGNNGIMLEQDDLYNYATVEQLNNKANKEHVHDAYETKEDASSKLDEAKAYTDSSATKVKNDLLNGAGDAYDTLKELGDLIDENVDAIDALEIVASNKADKDHMHTIESIDGLQEAVNNAADSKFYVVTFDMGDDNEYHGDLTFAEIREKFESGGNMVARIDGTDYIPLLSAASHQIIFSGIYQSQSVALTITSGDVCTLTTTPLAGREHTHSVATTTKDGYMSSEDKTKLDSVDPTLYETKEDAQLKYDEITSAKADWNQNDENEIDYVKNRTHYTEDGFLVYDQSDMLEYVTGSAPVAENEDKHSCQYLLISTEPIEYDELIGSILNTTEYDRTSRDTVDNTTIITNEHIIDDRINNKIVIKLNYEYVLIAYDSITHNDVTLGKGIWLIRNNIKFVDETWTLGYVSNSLSIPTKVYHTLSESYIPDTIARTSYVEENFALKADIENIDFSVYETKENAQSKLDEAKMYADNAVAQKTLVQMITWEADD